jgi:hypothetical protein
MPCIQHMCLCVESGYEPSLGVMLHARTRQTICEVSVTRLAGIEHFVWGQQSSVITASVSSVFSTPAYFSHALQIWAANPDGSNPRQLTTAEQGFQLAAHPAWSPDGARLAFTGMVAGALNVWIRNADGNVQQLTTSATASAISMVPAWTADGRRVVFESNRAVPPAESTPNDPYDVSVHKMTAAAAAITWISVRPYHTVSYCVCLSSPEPHADTCVPHVLWHSTSPL